MSSILVLTFPLLASSTPRFSQRVVMNPGEPVLSRTAPDQGCLQRELDVSSVRDPGIQYQPWALLKDQAPQGVEYRLWT